jgi:hypothetical protein
MTNRTTPPSAPVDRTGLDDVKALATLITILVPAGEGTARVCRPGGATRAGE